MKLDRYAVIGNPILHSRSPEIHAQFAAQCEQSISYDRLLAPLDGFNETAIAFAAAGGKGANVTVPFKLAAYSLATKLTQRAKAAGAVNTLSWQDGETIGDNTDGVGLVTDIKLNAQVSISGKRVLLLGAGGAARGALLPLLHEQPSVLVITNRSESKAHELADQFYQYGSGPVIALGYADLRDSFDIIINATSASLDATLPPLTAAVFHATSFAYDMMYGDVPTPFLQFAAANSVMVRDGLGMLVEQAAESFFVWRGVRPQTQIVYDELRAKLKPQNPLASI